MNPLDASPKTLVRLVLLKHHLFWHAKICLKSWIERSPDDLIGHSDGQMATSRAGVIMMSMTTTQIVLVSCFNVPNEKVRFSDCHNRLGDFICQIEII